MTGLDSCKYLLYVVRATSRELASRKLRGSLAHGKGYEAGIAWGVMDGS
jgi:hypothetical protein